MSPCVSWSMLSTLESSVFFFQAEDGIRDSSVTGVQTCALPIFGVPAADLGGDDRAALGAAVEHPRPGHRFEARPQLGRQAPGPRRPGGADRGRGDRKSVA